MKRASAQYRPGVSQGRYSDLTDARRAVSPVSAESAVSAVSAESAARPEP